MNLKLILQLSMFGLAMAIATVFVIPSKIEPAFWLAIFIACAVMVARTCSRRHFLHGLLISLANCVWITSAHIAFFDTYVARHAQEAQMLQSAALSGRVMMALTGPVVGLVSGVVLGLFCWVASKAVKPVAAGPA